MKKHVLIAWVLAVQAVMASGIGFSWDVVPKFLYISGTEQFDSKDLDYIAENFCWVTFAIGFGKNDHETYDEAFKHAALELKQRNPRIKVLYYWNAARCFSTYGRASETFMQHPGWDLSRGALGFNEDGRPIRLQNGVTTPEINIADSGARRWWLDHACKALALPCADGIWIDATARIYLPAARRKLEQAGLFAASEEALHAMYGELAECCRGRGKILMGNFLREQDGIPDEKLWAHFDGSFVENHYNLLEDGTPLEEYEAKIETIIKKTRTAAKNGKMIGFYAGGAFDPAYDPGQFSFEERKRKLREHFEYNLALYLILAEEGVYFEYNDGFRSNTHVWNAEYPEYARRLGKPAGPASKQGHVYQREFAHASVSLDIEKRSAAIIWR